MSKQKSISQDEDINTEKIGTKITNFDLIDSKLTLKEVDYLIKTATKLFERQPTLLQLSPPLKIVGDVCGHYKQLTKIFQIIGNPTNKNYLFLGNYTSKGTYSLETLLTLLYFKIKYPNNFFMLRGKFELPQNNFMFGFYQECLQKYDFKTWINFNQLFNYLPLAALVSDQIFCMSSGITDKILRIKQLKNIVKNEKLLQIPEIKDFLQSKPKGEVQKDVLISKNKRYFSNKTFYDWMNQNRLSLVVRSNQILQQGFQFSIENTLLTICSIPNFLQVQNLGAIVTINDQLVVSFQLLK